MVATIRHNRAGTNAVGVSRVPRGTGTAILAGGKLNGASLAGFPNPLVAAPAGAAGDVVAARLVDGVVVAVAAVVTLPVASRVG